MKFLVQSIRNVSTHAIGEFHKVCLGCVRTHVQADEECEPIKPRNLESLLFQKSVCLPHPALHSQTHLIISIFFPMSCHVYMGFFKLVLFKCIF